MRHGKSWGSVAVMGVATAMVISMSVATTASAAEGEARTNGRTPRQIEVLAALDLAAPTWFERLGESLLALWDASRGIIVPGDDGGGTNGATTPTEPADSATTETPTTQE